MGIEDLNNLNVKTKCHEKFTLSKSSKSPLNRECSGTLKNYFQRHFSDLVKKSGVLNEN